MAEDDNAQQLEDLKARVHRHLVGLLKALDRMSPEERQQVSVSIEVKLKEHIN